MKENETPQEICIVPATEADIPDVLRIYGAAREFMRRSGNPNQWNPGYPSEETLRRDMEAGGSYVLKAGGRPVATFFLSTDPEPTYSVIRDGAWLDDLPYGVVHRVASDGSLSGVMPRVLDFCFARIRNIRIDTHRDNLVMQRALLRYGFSRCGIIFLADGSSRIAYQLRLP